MVGRAIFTFYMYQGGGPTPPEFLGLVRPGNHCDFYPATDRNFVGRDETLPKGAYTGVTGEALFPCGPARHWPVRGLSGGRPGGVTSNQASWPLGLRLV